MSPYEIVEILALANDTIDHLVRQYTPDWLVPLMPGVHRRRFTQYLPGEPEARLRVWNAAEAIDEFTLGLLQAIVKGLVIFLVDGSRNYRTWFRVTTGRFNDHRVAMGYLKTEDLTVDQ